MAYVEPPNRATALFVTAAIWNQDLAENLRSLFPDGVAGVAWSPGLDGTGGAAEVTQTGRRYRVGALQHVWWRGIIVSGGGSGAYFVTLPVPAVGVTGSASEGSGHTVGAWTLRDDNGPKSRNGSVVLRAANEVWFNQGPGNVTHLSPFDIEPGDSLSFHAVYPFA